MTALEVLALIFAIVVLVKLLIFIINPKCLIKISKGMLKKTVLVKIVYLILAIIVGYYIFSSLNIVVVASVMLFTSLLIGLNFLSYSKAIPEILKEIPEKRLAIIGKFWFPILIWVALAIWTLFAVFA